VDSVAALADDSIWRADCITSKQCMVVSITSSDARENDTTQTSKVSKYQIISQLKLHKFHVKCYIRHFKS